MLSFFTAVAAIFMLISKQDGTNLTGSTEWGKLKHNSDTFMMATAFWIVQLYCPCLLKSRKLWIKICIKDWWESVVVLEFDLFKKVISIISSWLEKKMIQGLYMPDV